MLISEYFLAHFRFLSALFSKTFFRYKSLTKNKLFINEKFKCNKCFFFSCDQSKKNNNSMSNISVTQFSHASRPIKRQENQKSCAVFFPRFCLYTIMRQKKKTTGSATCGHSNELFLYPLCKNQNRILSNKRTKRTGS